MLVVDHAINGELFAWTPMEMLKVGVPMSVAITLVWLGYAMIKEYRSKRLVTNQ